MDLAELRDLPLVYVDDLDRPVLTEADVKHFERVLRRRPGDPLLLGDGRGGWRPARYGREPEPIGPGGRQPPPRQLITVAFAPVKGERVEWYTQKLTELGVDRIIPVITERTVVRWDDERAAKAHDRMTIVARESCLQSRRLHLPAVEAATSFDRLLAARPEAVLADPGGRPLEPAHLTLVVGPEGGFTAEERSSAPSVSLPGNVLRAPTAAIMAAGIACGLRSGHVGPGAGQTRIG